MPTKVHPLVRLVLHKDAPLSRPLCDLALTLLSDHLVSPEELYRRPEFPADLAKVALEQSLVRNDGTVRAMSPEESASWLLRPEQRPEHLTASDVAGWDDDLLEAVADRACRIPPGAARLPQNLLDILITHRRLDIRATMLRAEGDTPRARTVIDDIGRAALALSDGFIAPRPAGTAKRVVDAIMTTTGWTVSNELQRYALATWEAPWAVARCGLYNAGPELANRFAVQFLIPALDSGAIDAREYAYDTVRVLGEGVGAEVAAAIAKHWTAAMIEEIDERDGELGGNLTDAFTSRGLVFPGPAHEKVADSLGSEWLAEQLEELAGEYPHAWTLTAQLLEMDFAGTNEALLAVVRASSD